MPCWADRTVQHDFRASDPVILREALSRAGWIIGLDEAVAEIIKTGRLMANKISDIDVIKRLYAEGVIDAAAKRMGWQVKRSRNQREFVLARR